MPIAIERIREVEGKLLTQKETRVTEWKDLGGGVWVPVKAVTRYFDPDPKWETFGELAVEDVLVVDVDRSTWNKEIPEDTFNLALPAGTKVTDTLREVQLITGQPDPGKNLDDLAGHAKKIVPYPVPHPPAVKSSPLWPWIVGGGFVGVAAVVALYYKFFYARKRQTGQIP